VDPVLLQGGWRADGALLAGRYRLVGRIGAGGMATIYCARDETLDREVAVKVLHPHLADDPDVRERFRAEARAAAALVSPHVVNVFDTGVEDLPFIVMEYVDGPSLREVLAARGRLAPGEALAVLEPVCAGLSRAHARGLVHRDVKPENVLVARDGVVKVADFGIARAADAGATASGALVASVHYVAPELVHGDEATPTSDQYAVGVLLYELLTGHQPFDGDSPTAVALRHTHESVPPPSELVPGLAPELDAVVARATAHEPGARFPDLSALIAAVRAAVPEGPSPVVVATGGGHPNGTLIIPRESLDTTTIAPGTLDTRPRFSSGAWRPRVPRPRLGTWASLLLLLLVLAGVSAWFLFDQVLAPVRVVPELVGAHRDEADAALRGLGLLPRYAEPASSREVPADHVLALDPAQGAQLRQGGEVSLTLSSGPAIVEMPRVLELPREEALALLQAPGFQVRIDGAYSDTVPLGTVQGQLPDPGTRLAEGSPVVINVSLGIEQVAVPDLEERSADEAAQLLAEAGLEGEFIEEFSDDHPEPGQVLSQSVAPGTQVDKGSTVEVVVSAGPTTISLPEVRGRPVDEAVQVLEELGLDVDVIEREQPLFGPFRLAPTGDVREQDPAPGTQLRRGDRVRLLTYVEADGEGEGQG
jgi:beta-lactam-binding protein with PASTA domain